MSIVLKRRPSNSTSEDDDDDGVDCPLSGAEALAACKEFASVTNTDTGLAMMMLQKNQWELQRAIKAYQDSTNSKSKSTQKQTISSVNCFIAYQKLHSSFCLVVQMSNE